jgi:hypothetical protein
LKIADLAEVKRITAADYVIPTSYALDDGQLGLNMQCNKTGREEYSYI